MALTGQHRVPRGREDVYAHGEGFEEKWVTPKVRQANHAVTATHLKRLFPTQDPFGTMDKTMANLSVPEVDEREKSEGSTESKLPSPTLTESVEATLQLPDSGPTTDSPMSLDEAAANPLDTAAMQLEGITASYDSITPTPTLARISSPFTTADVPRDYDSDSTISAIPGRSIPKTYTAADLASSGVDSDTHGFVSRLPRRTRPAPSVADLVKRFQESMGQTPQFEPIPNQDIPSSMERPRSAGGTTRRVRPEPDVSDSDVNVGVLPVRPRLRGRREQPSKSRMEPRSTLLSEGERSYAVNAARVVSHTARRSATVDASSSTRGGRISRTTSPTPSHRSRDGLLAAPSPRLPLTKAASHEGKPRIAGKGRTPRKATDVLAPPGQPSPGGGLIRGLPRRVIGAGSRVTSIARHFDKISREAERDRQKRISIARGKRAGRVGVTKAKVQVFNNMRDAFKDEFDSDSSAADNEEDEGDASDGSVDSTGRARPRRKVSSPTKGASPLPQPIEGAGPSESTHTETPPQASTPEDQVTAPTAGPSGVLSDSATDGGGTGTSTRNKDRLHIELAPFDTNAPLPPMTPQPQQPATTDTQDEGGPRKGFSQLSQMSESEMSSGGGETRSSILKTLTGLWAFRAGDFTPLEYPLSAAEHIFADSRVIVRENEPTSIIAFTLSSKTYRDQMRSVAAAAKARRHEPSGLDDLSMTSDRQWDIISIDEGMEADDPSRREGEVGTHLKYDFETGSSTISCRIFFAEQFAALRQACQCEDIFVESLARCAKFDASGGKSGSAFLKTKGGLHRFVSMANPDYRRPLHRQGNLAIRDGRSHQVRPGILRVHVHCPPARPADRVGQDVRLFQDWIPQRRDWTLDAHERAGAGEPVLFADVCKDLRPQGQHKEPSHQADRQGQRGAVSLLVVTAPA